MSGPSSVRGVSSLGGWVRRRAWTALPCALAALWAVVPAHAQQRDPTQPPAAALQPEAGGANGAGAGSGRSMTLIVRDGTPYLVVDTRLYAQGQMLGKAKILRITETEVTLRESGQTTVLRPFEGIQRRTVSAVPACASSAPKTRAANRGGADAACGGTKP